MRIIQLIPNKTRIDFIKYKKITFLASIFVMSISIFSILVQGINYGIDFKGGVLVEIRTMDTMKLPDIRLKLSKLKSIEVIKIQSIGTEKDFMIYLENKSGNIGRQKNILREIKNVLDNKIQYRKIVSIGSSISKEMKKNGIISVIIAIISMMIYIWLRFDWQFSICAMLALVHDTVAIVGIYSIFKIEFNENMIVAMLTTVGYSINDTVVIFDRIREKSIKEIKHISSVMINNSINETLSRTILTSLTTLISLLSLYILGNATIQSFSFPMIIGVIVGTYSSIYIASTLLLMFRIKPLLK
jgi:preprotein translocase subunit SecF